MTRAILSAVIDSDWRQVSQERPCPVCGADHACSIHTVDAFVSCAREPSQWKLTNGSWLHRITQQSGGRKLEVLAREAGPELGARP
ncbi:MAG TPA: hypothetical protein VHB79_05400 [Polyangiaceae bacterium]|nr:hypothetical protein [Polyangiaceae bacterium]